MGSAESLARALERKVTVYLSRNAGSVFMRGKALVVDQSGATEIPLERLRRVVLLGKPPLGTPLLYRLAKAGIPVDWLDIFGRPVAQILSLEDPADQFMPPQTQFAKKDASLTLARHLLAAKLDNCLEIMRRRVKLDNSWAERKKAIEDAPDAASLRGAEGIAARMYFSLWPPLLENFIWHGRRPHPAPDPVNMLLSLGYGLLHNRLSGALAALGLNPRIGFFHRGRGRHCALASDLMEPFRPIVDSEVISMIRRREISPDQFRMRGERCACADGEIFVQLLHAFEKMFAAPRVFYPDPSNRHAAWHDSLNGCFDELAESFRAHISKGSPCFIPRLRPCPAS